MSAAWAIVITVAAAGVAIAAILIVRRHAPAGSYFADGDRAAGVFGVIATGFSVLLGLIVFLAFESYDQSRSGAEAEARLVAQQFETAQFLPVAVRRQLGDELVCYARFVVSEWPRLASAAHDNTVDTANPWVVALFRTLKITHPRTVVEQTAYDKWLDRTADREVARNDRIHGAVGVIPGTLWVVLFFITAAIFVFMLFFADSGERAVTQALMMGSVIAVITATLLLIRFLDDPFRNGFGGLKPVAMERTLGILDKERRVVGDTGAPPCDARGGGNPLTLLHDRKSQHEDEPARQHRAGEA
jgi:amino acid transporter